MTDNSILANGLRIGSEAGHVKAVGEKKVSPAIDNIVTHRVVEYIARLMPPLLSTTIKAERL
jgi:hypothetical protein